MFIKTIINYLAMKKRNLEIKKYLKKNKSSN